MVVVLLPALGVVACLVAGVVLALAPARRRFQRQPGTFRCNLRVQSGVVPGLGERWPRGASYAVWAHDSLVVCRGRWRVSTLVLPTSAAEGSLETADGGLPTSRSTGAVALTLRLDSGSRVRVVAPADERSKLAGPYLVADLQGDGADVRRT